MGVIFILKETIDGSDFYDTIQDLGETIIFKTEPEIIQYASITPQRTTNTTDGAYWYTGAMTFDDVEQQNRLIGEYFTRQTNPAPLNILTAVMPENTTPKVATVYSVECNETVDLVSHYQKTGEKNEYNEDIYEPIFIAQDVPVYSTMTLAKLQEETVGSMVETVLNLIVPAKYALSQDNIVLKPSFVFDNKLKKNVYKKIKYRFESIDTSMMDMIDDVPVGIMKCMLTEDKR